MYKTLLILKYLRKRRIAWVSLIAVMLCTTMVIVVMSVMSGWLGMFRESYRGLTGDVIIARRSWSGFPHYQEIIDRLIKEKEIAAVVPTVQTYGLVNVKNQIRTGVQVVGFPIDQIGKVNQFPQSLYRQHSAEADGRLSALQKAELRVARRETPSFQLPLDPEVYRQEMQRPGRGDAKQRQDPSTWPGMIVGTGVVGIRKNEDGTIDHQLDLLLTANVRLMVMGMDEDSATFDLEANKAERNYWIVDSSRTGIFQQDENTVYVPFDVLQRDLRMAGDEYTDAITGQKMKTPARVTNLQVAFNKGYSSQDALPKIQKIVAEVMESHGYTYFNDPVRAKTWEQISADYINAIEREIVLTTLLFSIISVVAVFLIFCIFYMIVAEKTRDIGIIKSVGATGGGVASIFIGYGLVIGIVGGGLGLLVSYLIVHNINEIHAWMGRQLGVKMWDAKTYMFDSIPNELDPTRVSVIVAVAIISSVIGSLIPAYRAARMNPVEALRWE